jgi:hypothetical protein
MSTRALLTIAWMGLAPLLAAADRVVPYREQAPSPLAVPSPPTTKASPGELAPENSPLERNDAVAARFATEGQCVSYEFESQAGELSLFELESFGYSRGWESTAGIRILDASGQALKEVVRTGGMTYSNFVSFQAPKTGTYRYELCAREESFRYSLVRHSGYFQPDADEIMHLGQADQAESFLADAWDVRRFAIDMKPGEQVLIRVGALRKKHRNRLLGTRAQVLASFLSDELLAQLFDLDSLLMQARAGSPGREQLLLSSVPFHGLRLVRDGRVIASAGSMLMHTADREGLYQIEVSINGLSEGGLFSLQIERDPELHTVSGRVGDLDDDALQDVTLRFLSEPDLAALAQVVTGVDGTYEARLPAGDYSVLLHKGLNSRVERVRTRVRADTELNLVCSVPDGR